MFYNFRTCYNTVSRTQMPFQNNNFLFNIFSLLSIFNSTFSLFSLLSLSPADVLSLFLLLQITLPHPQINSDQAADHRSSRLIVLHTPSFNGTTTSSINGTPSFYVSVWHSHRPLATTISPSPISSLWVCAGGCGCGLVDVGLCRWWV